MLDAGAGVAVGVATAGFAHAAGAGDAFFFNLVIRGSGVRDFNQVRCWSNLTGPHLDIFIIAGGCDCCVIARPKQHKKPNCR
jgi:hypothetical protein